MASIKSHYLFEETQKMSNITRTVTNRGLCYKLASHSLVGSSSSCDECSNFSFFAITYSVIRIDRLLGFSIMCNAQCLQMQGMHDIIVYHLSSNLLSAINYNRLKSRKRYARLESQFANCYYYDCTVGIYMPCCAPEHNSAK